MSHHLPRTVAVCALALAACPAAAQASAGQMAIFQDDGQLTYRSDRLRDHTLNEIAGLGADVIKIELLWARIAPRGSRRPAHFDATNPDAYPAGVWVTYDNVIRAVQARGLRVLLAPTGPAPGWATGSRRHVEGVQRPDARAYGAFVRAAGARYDGSHRDASGQPLPRVDFWTIWNEPNGIKFLAPQSDRRGPIAPRLYRNLVTSGLAGLAATGHARDRILFGELLPIGQDRIDGNEHPLAFMRELFCLDRRYRAYRGAAARQRGCASYRRITGVSGFSYHPYVRPSGPSTVERSRDDATIRSLGRVAAVLDRAAQRGRLGRTGLPIYNTEFGIQTNPPDPLQAPIRRAPSFLNQAEWLSYANPRVISWSQYLLVDDPRSSAAGAFESGLRFRGGRAKPGVYGAFRLPIWVSRAGRSTVRFWGAVRPGGPGSVAALQVAGTRGSFRTVKTVTVGSPEGYFLVDLRLSQPERRRYRLLVATGPARGTSRIARLGG